MADRMSRGRLLCRRLGCDPLAVFTLPLEPYMAFARLCDRLGRATLDANVVGRIWNGKLATLDRIQITMALAGVVGHATKRRHRYDLAVDKDRTARRLHARCRSSHRSGIHDDRLRRQTVRCRSEPHVHKRGRSPHVKLDERMGLDGFEQRFALDTSSFSVRSNYGSLYDCTSCTTIIECSIR